MRAEFPKVISLRLERELREALKAEAARRNESVSEFLRREAWRAVGEGERPAVPAMRA